MTSETAVGYIRLSQDGTSLARQRRDVEDSAAANDYILAEVYNEGTRASGFDTWGWAVVGLLLIAIVAFILWQFTPALVFAIFIYYAMRRVYRCLNEYLAYPDLTATVTLLVLVLPALAVVAYALVIAVIVHLTSINLVVYEDVSCETATEKLGQLTKKYNDEFSWLDPPENRGDITVVDVAEARDLDEHTELVRDWARSVWQAWEKHHPTLEQWTKRAVES